MTGDEHDAIAHEFLGDSHGLLWIACVVGQDQFDPLPENTTSFIDVGDRHLRAMLNLLAPEDVLSGKGPGSGDQNLGPCAGRSGQRRNDGREQQNFQVAQHQSLLR